MVNRIFCGLSLVALVATTAVMADETTPVTGTVETHETTTHEATVDGQHVAKKTKKKATKKTTAPTEAPADATTAPVDPAAAPK